MEIKFSTDNNHNLAFVDVNIFEDKGDNQPWNKADIVMLIPYDDSNAVMRQRANDELTTFLKKVLAHLENSNSQ